jgi:hypothetical protein
MYHNAWNLSESLRSKNVWFLTTFRNESAKETSTLSGVQRTTMEPESYESIGRNMNVIQTRLELRSKQ